VNRPSEPPVDRPMDPPVDRSVDTPKHGGVIRPLSSGMRRLLVAVAVLDLLAGTQAFVLSEHTVVFFAWPIEAPLTAAFVGASFWAAGVLIFWASRQDTFVRARIVVRRSRPWSLRC
jgi:hypothetical protein